MALTLEVFYKIDGAGTAVQMRSLVWDFYSDSGTYVLKIMLNVLLTWPGNFNLNLVSAQCSHAHFL